ncbi:hypothetical protein BGZ94_006032, partial [Podila epigama]
MAAWKSTFQLSPTDRQALANVLTARHGWQTCPCAGEADVCIARRANNAPTPVTVASTDSDYL